MIAVSMAPPTTAEKSSAALISAGSGSRTTTRVAVDFSMLLTRSGVPLLMKQSSASGASPAPVRVTTVGVSCVGIVSANSPPKTTSRRATVPSAKRISAARTWGRFISIGGSEAR